MKALKLILALFILTQTVSAQKRTVDVSNFSELSFAVGGNVYLRQGSDEKVEVDCSDEVFEKLEFRLSGDRLTIRRESSWSWRDTFRNSDLDIYITMKDIERLSVSGSGRIMGENRIKSDDLRLSISGSGDIELDIDSDEVETRISGSGDIELEGVAGKAKAKISGSGKVRAGDMEVRVFEASISGSGNCYVSVTDEVVANISGSGNVYYNGDPDRVIGNSSGSGKLRRQ